MSFYNCFNLSAGKAAASFSWRKAFTAAFNKRRPFILIRDGRLAIDHSSYGNLTDQINFLSLHFVPLAPRFN